jgi:UDP-3-O-[3-hydroxymyristoyl] glucosamine N-acyltransferase
MKIYELAQIADGTVIGDGNIDITGVADLATAENGEIAFIEKAENLQKTFASCLLVSENIETNCSLILVKDPKLAFTKIAQILYPPKNYGSYIHPFAIISESAFCYIGENSEIADNTQLRAGVKIGDNVLIGANCTIHPNVFIEDNCTIGNNVILHSGVIIGADGFGYVRDGANGYVKFPQIGTVVIEDNVEIGANSCVDRGALGETRIGEGTKIDNLVQVAHNVQIGKRVVIAAQTGISGSTIIEDDCVIGGQVGIGDHAKILSGAIVGSQAGILPNKIVRAGIWWGTPVQPLAEYKRQNAMVKGLGRLREEIKELKKKLKQ